MYEERIQEITRLLHATLENVSVYVSLLFAINTLKVRFRALSEQWDGTILYTCKLQLVNGGIKLLLTFCFVVKYDVNVITTRVV